MEQNRQNRHVINVGLLRIQTDAALDVLSRRNADKDEVAECARAFLVYLLTLRARGHDHAGMDDKRGP